MKRRTQILSLLLTVLMMSSLFSGCMFFTVDPGQDSTPQTSTMSEETVEESTSASGEAQASQTEYPLTITDSSGREVVFESEPQKIVSLGPNMTELVFALGAGYRLAGRTTYCDYPEEAAEVPAVGTLMEPDFEKITEIRPDLVLASTHVSDETLDKLQDLNIPVIMLYDEHHLDGLKDIILTLGKILNVNDAAEALAKETFDRINAVREKTADLEKIPVYYVVGFGEYGEFTAGGDTFINDMIEAAGGENVAKDVKGWSFSLEQLLEADPRVIIVQNWAKDTFGKDEPYSQLTAVKEGRVFAIDNNLLDRQGPRNADGVEALAAILDQVRNGK